MPERTIIQWDKDDLESLGLLKVDVLALGMLSALRRMLALLKNTPGRPRTGPGWGTSSTPAAGRRTFTTAWARGT